MTETPPTDPWAPGVRAADVPIEPGGDASPFAGDANGHDSGSALCPSRADISKHLYALFPPDFVKAYPDAWIEIATASAPTGWKPIAAEHFSPFNLPEAIAYAEKANKAGKNVYVGPSLRQGTTGQSGRSTDVNFLASARAWSDLDGAGDFDRVSDILKANALQNDLLVMTGTVPHKRAHPYFKLAGVVTAEQQKAVNVALKTLLGTDNVDDACRLMRLAGCINYPSDDKRERGYVPERVTLHIRKDAPSYTVEQLLGFAGKTSGPSSNIFGFPDTKPGRTDDELLAKLGASRAPGKWHNNIREAIATMIGRKWDDLQIRLACAPYCKDGANDPDLDDLINRGRAKWDKPDEDPGADVSGAGTASANTFRATPYTWKNPADIPQRDWLYGRLLIRKFVTATVAPGGLGKSTLIAAETLAQVSGRDLIGTAPKQQLRVWLWNLEDPQQETERKIQAAAKLYGLNPEDLGNRLFVDSGRDQKLVIATTNAKGGPMIVRPVVDALIAEIKDKQIDVLTIDPFVSCHELPENDNTAQDMLVKEWGKVAEWGDCAVHLVDHTRKMNGSEAEVTTESSRGAKAKTDAARVVRVVNRMSKDEGEKSGVENHRLYFRTYNDKANLAPPVDRSDWFELKSVDLGNGPRMEVGGTSFAPGDSVGVVKAWEWPDPLAGMTGADFDKVAAVIRADKWRADFRAKAWVGHAVAQALKLDAGSKRDRARIGGMLGIWIGAGSLIVVEGEDEKRMTKKFVEVKGDD